MTTPQLTPLHPYPPPLSRRGFAQGYGPHAAAAGPTAARERCPRHPAAAADLRARCQRQVAFHFGQPEPNGQDVPGRHRLRLSPHRISLPLLHGVARPEHECGPAARGSGRRQGIYGTYPHRLQRETVTHNPNWARDRPSVAAPRGGQGAREGNTRK